MRTLKILVDFQYKMHQDTLINTTQECNIKIYYRSPNGKLNSYETTITDMQEARLAMLQHLYDTKEEFINPVLAVLDGGKHG